MKITQLTDKEVFDRKDSEVVVDVESYQNYTLICFEYTDGAKVFFEWRGQTPIGFNKVKLRWMLENNVIHTFNGNSYDMVVMKYLLLSPLPITTADMYEATQELIARNTYWMRFYQMHKIAWGMIECNHVDLIEVAFGKSSLKLYAGRLHAEKMQDLPYDFWMVLSEEQMDHVLSYCWNDTVNTWLLKNFLEKDIELRRQMSMQYGVDVRSKSDAQVAEAVIGAELQLIHGITAKKPVMDPSFSFKYKIPSDVHFKSKIMNKALDILREADFTLSDVGKIVQPAGLDDLKIKMASDTVYKMGMGGIHSTEKWMKVEHDPDYMLIDRDAASFYPMIILNQGLYPKQLTKKFIEVYRKIVMTRLKAKAEGDKRTAGTLKIVINGSFGKFGSVFSILFAPELLIQTTISGQLYLLMLTERLELAGFNVFSGNTDGIVTRLHKDRYDEFNEIIYQWERDTGFDTDETLYHSYFAANVNNYIAVKPDGEIKAKGMFGKTGISKNPAASIMYRAVTEFVSRGVPVADTIGSCTDIREFVTVRKVKGGCVDAAGNMIGATVRFFRGKGVFTNLKYKKNGNKVPTTDGCVPIMCLTDEQTHAIDYSSYIRSAESLLQNWYKPQVKQLTLFD